MAAEKITIQVDPLNAHIFQWLGELSPAQQDDFVFRLMDAVQRARAHRGAAPLRTHRPLVARRDGVVQFPTCQATAQQDGVR